MKKTFLMREVRLSFLIFFLTLGFFVILPPKTLSATNPVINEFLANPSSGENEWVELYNDSSEEISLTGWKLSDGANSKKSLDSLDKIPPKSFVIYEYPSGDGWLNNTTSSSKPELISLLNNSDVVIDSYQYEVNQQEDVSIGRFPDGNGEFNILSSSTKGSSNSLPFIPTSTPVPTNTLAPTKTPTPIKTSTSKTAIKAVDTTVIKQTSVPITSQVQKTVSNSSKSVLGSKNQPTIRLSDEKEISSPTSSINNSIKTKEVKTLGASQNNLPKILIGAGIIFVILCGILFGRSFRKKISNENE